MQTTHSSAVRGRECFIIIAEDCFKILFRVIKKTGETEGFSFRQGENRKGEPITAENQSSYIIDKRNPLSWRRRQFIERR